MNHHSHSTEDDPLVKLAPVHELHLEGPIATANPQKSKKLNYSVVENLDQLEWFVKSKESEQVNKQAHHHKTGFLKSLKPQMDTRIETQTLYFSDLHTGKSGFVQLLYSSVLGGVYHGFQINFKVFHPTDDKKEEDVWESFKLDYPSEFSSLKVKTKQCTFEFIPVNKNIACKTNSKEKIIGHLLIEIDFKSKANANASTPASMAKDLKINLQCDLYKGFMVNPNGCTFFLDKPMLKSKLEQDTTTSKLIRHMFIPKAVGKGTIQYHDHNDKLITIHLSNVPMCYIDAVHGLLPNKEAARWNFLTFQSKHHSLLCMEFVTPKEYGNTSVTVWSISQNDKLVTIGAKVNSKRHRVRYPETTKDEDSGWDYPTAIRFPGFKEDNLRLINRYDVMGELPGFVKTLAEKYVHIKPYIYQYCQNSTYHRDKGISIIETSFIS